MDRIPYDIKILKLIRREYQLHIICVMGTLYHYKRIDFLF